MSKDEQNNTQKAEAEKSFNAIPWIAGAVLVLGLAVLAGLYWDRTSTIRDVRFEGNYYVTTNELEQKADVPMGVSPDSLNFIEIINRVEAIPYVHHADINVEPSGNLLMDITERKPIALLADGDQKIYVDKDGIRLPLILEKTVDVPILYGFSASPMQDTLKSDAFKSARNFLIEMHQKPVSNATISEIGWTTNNGVVALTNENGVKLIFGKEDFKTRLRNWEAFYGKIIKTKGIASMRSIDLRFKGQIVTQET